jgi:hypothetical protein
MADRICNLDTPPHYWKQEKIIQYREEAREIYNALSSNNNYLGNRLLNDNISLPWSVWVFSNSIVISIYGRVMVMPKADFYIRNRLSGGILYYTDT